VFADDSCRDSIFFGHWWTDDGAPPAQVSEIWRIYIFSYEHFWFLQGLIIIFPATMLIETLGGLASLGRQLAVLVKALLLYRYEPLQDIDLFSLSEGIYLFPFFLLGIGANRFRHFFFSPAVVGVTIVAFFLGLCIQVYEVFELYDSPQDKRSALAIIVGFSTTLLVIRWLPRQRLLAYIGAYSFAIYLYHPLFAAAIRMVGSRVAAAPLSALFWAGFAAGVAGPILMATLVSRHRVTRTIMLGQK